MAETDCIFCKIVAGEVPSTLVDEDEHTIAFMDINPVTRGHALVIPRAHSTDLGDINPDDLAAVSVAAKRLAAKATEALGADGINILVCSGPVAWQTVYHFHMHVIPRYAGDGRVKPPTWGTPGNPDEIAATGAILRS